jgi:hypothetical protein
VGVGYARRKGNGCLASGYTISSDWHPDSREWKLSARGSGGVSRDVVWRSLAALECLWCLVRSTVENWHCIIIQALVGVPFALNMPQVASSGLNQWKRCMVGGSGKVVDRLNFTPHFTGGTPFRDDTSPKPTNQKPSRTRS